MAGVPRINLIGGFVGPTLFVAAARKVVNGDDAAEAGAREIKKTIIRSLLKPGAGIHWPGMEHPSSLPGASPALQTGRLAASISVWKEGKSWRVGVAKDALAADYAAALEFGNSHIAPRPYIRAAAASSESRMVRAAAVALARSLIGRQALGAVRGSFR